MKWKQVSPFTAILLATLFIWGFSCSQKGKELPPEVLDSLTDEQIEQLKNHGLTIYEGTDPPNVEGSYLTDGELCIYSYDDDTGWTTSPYYYNYTNQSNENITVAYNSPDAGESATGDVGYISGSGNNFSIFVISNGTSDSIYSDHVIKYTLVTIYSGSIDTDGIHDFEYAFICTHKENDIHEEFMDVNGDRVFKEEDGLAERLSEWPFSTRSIEDTISQFESAANTQNFNSFKDTLSQDSQFWITGDPAIQSFLEDYLETLIPITYGNLSISEMGNDATVTTTATYNILQNVPIRFEMRKHGEVWKVKECWDDPEGDGLEFVWLKIKDFILLEE